MNRLIIILLFLVLPFWVVSQDDNTFMFKVRNPVSEISVKFANSDTIFYTDFNNWFSIDVTGKNKLGPVQLVGGELRRQDNTFMATVSEGTEVLLIVYLTKPDGSVDLGMSLPVSVEHLKDPVPYIALVKPDSIITHKDLLTSQRMHAKMKRFGKTSYLTVESFDMVVSVGEEVDTLKSYNERFTIQMRRHMQTLKPGVPIYFANIICRMPSGEIRRLKDARFFVDLQYPYWIKGVNEE